MPQGELKFKTQEIYFKNQKILYKAFFRTILLGLFCKVWQQGVEGGAEKISLRKFQKLSPYLMPWEG